MASSQIETVINFIEPDAFGAKFYQTFKEDQQQLSNYSRRQKQKGHFQIPYDPDMKAE